MTTTVLEEAIEAMNAARCFLIREYPAEPDTGEVIEGQLPRLVFNQLSTAQAACESTVATALAQAKGPVSEYCIAADCDWYHLVNKVNVLAAEGWRPSGSLAISQPNPSDNWDGCFYQPMVR